METLREAAQTWSAESQLAVKSLEFYSSSQTMQPGHEGCVSLVSMPLCEGSGESRLVYFQWTVPGQQGRIADVTEDYFLKCIVPVGKKKTPLNLETVNGSIILPSTGARIVKDKQLAQLKSRFIANKIPEPVQRFERMWKVAERQRQGTARSDPDLFVLADADTCFVCLQGKADNTNVSNVVDEDDGGDSDPDVEHDNVDEDKQLSVCHFCLLCSHTHCAQQLVDAFHSDTVCGNSWRSLELSQSLRESIPDHLSLRDRPGPGLCGSEVLSMILSSFSAASQIHPKIAITVVSRWPLFQPGQSSPFNAAVVGRLSGQGWAGRQTRGRLGRPCVGAVHALPSGWLLCGRCLALHHALTCFLFAFCCAAGSRACFMFHCLTTMCQCAHAAHGRCASAYLAVSPWSAGAVCSCCLT